MNRGAHGHNQERNSGYAPPPEPNYGAPEPNYGAPAPAPSYGAPAPSYETPSTGYGPPDTGYGNEPSGYGDDDLGLPDFTPMIILMIALIGLSLLFPTYVNINPPEVDTTTGRKRRYADYYDNYADYDMYPMTPFEKALEIYDHLNAALQPVDKRCVEKIICEAGELAGDVGLTKNPIFRLFGGFVPSKYSRLFKYFAYGENCYNMKCSAYQY